MTTNRRSLLALPLLAASAAPALGQAQPQGMPPRIPLYDFAAADALLEAELPRLLGNVAVLVHQGGEELYRFQAGSIGYDTRTRLASLTKTLSGAVILDLVEDGVLALDETLGTGFPALFGGGDLGTSTVLDAWSMTHGIETPAEFHRDPGLTHAQSVVRIATQGYRLFEPGTQLGYDGCAMQVTGLLAAIREGADWEAVARQRLFDPVGMPQADFQQFAPNPAVAGGARSSARELMRFADMVLAQGTLDSGRVLEESSVELMFTNRTRGLPVAASPFPATHPDYPYGTDPDYSFGAWVLAEDPVTQHEEELVGAGAWGSYLWIDRRRGLTAVLVTDVVPGTGASMDAALGLFRIARQAVEERQARRLETLPLGSAGTLLTWVAPDLAGPCELWGSPTPIRDVHDLGRAVPLGTSFPPAAVVPPFPHYAVTSTLAGHPNRAIVPGRNATTR